MQTIKMTPEAVVLNSSDCILWAPYKALFNVVNRAITLKDPDAIPDLENALRNHKPDFICLLKNPGRSEIHREAVKNASTTGIAIVGQPGTQVLAQQLVDEALIVSDMFELNELTSLELLIAGQQQQPHFTGLTRGLVAMLLYYDGHRCLVNSLRMLVQAREGRLWTLGLSSELSALVTTYTDHLKEEGLIIKIIDLIENMNIAKELDLLHKNRALGGPRYRKQVTDMIAEIKNSLAEIVFYWTCQCSLNHVETVRLMNFLSKQSSACVDAALDEPTLTLAMAFLYIIDVSCLQTCDELDPLVQNLNLVRECDLGITIHKELSMIEQPWQMTKLKNIFQFAWGISLRTMSQFPVSSFSEELRQYFEEDEKMIELAIDAEAFIAIQNLIIHSSSFFNEEYFIRRIHNLIADFIVLMPIKVKDMRNRGDESARIIAAHMQEGLEAPNNIPMHFKQLLNLITELYAKNPLELNLALDYWCPVDILMDQLYVQRPSQRQVALFKFVRIAGDLLPPPLFVPYHQMLTSLSSSKVSAHHCFNLLKINGRHVGGHYNIVSWDHFFVTLHNYYNNLREELAVTPDTGFTYRQRMLTKGITPQEVDGLSAVLELIAQVVKQDEVARVTLAENPQYLPFIVLLGLITCSIPSVLKSSLIRCLVAFSSSSEIAFNIWHGLESSQVIPTVPTTFVYYPSGILMELEEVESRNEAYPVTVATLELISKLLDHPLPVALGAGQRKPGLQPYIDFVRDKVLLRCNARVFKSQVEKWNVIKLCLKILAKSLRSYNVKSDTTVVPPAEASSLPAISSIHPGFSVLSEMLYDSGLLKIVLFILDEGIRVLDMYSPYDGLPQLEKCVLLSLELLHLSLAKQDAFLQCVRDSGSGLLVTTLDNLLVGINPRSGKADHLFNISKYITYNTVLPHQSLLSIRILLFLCSSSHIVQHLMAIFDVDPKESDALLHGFVECLEVDIAGEQVDQNSNNVEDSSTEARNKARVDLLMLILNCLKFRGPNLAHHLLGFNVVRPICQTEIQEPGVMQARRTCLHATLALLDAGTNTSAGPINVYKSPKATELAYQLIYMLCNNRDTSGPTLRYLRSTHDFFYRHLQFLPFKNKDKCDVKYLAQQSWFLRALAIELRVTSAHHQRSHVHRLLLRLLEDKLPANDGSSDSTIEPPTGALSSAYSFIKPSSGPVRRKLIHILGTLDFKQSQLSVPNWEYFDIKELLKLCKDCENHDASNVPVIDVEELSRRLKEETAAVQNASSFGQRAVLLQQEISAVLQYAMNYNVSRQSTYAKQQSFEAWRQVTEVLLIACPLDIFGSEKKHQIVLEISQELIRRVMTEDFLLELMPAASGIILTLMATLRHSVMSTMLNKTALLQNTNVALSVPEFPTASMCSINLAHHSSLLIVLKAIIECLLQSSSGLQRVRANFYTAFLNLLCIVQEPAEMQGYTTCIESVVLNQDSEIHRLRTEYMDTILSFGESLMEIICRDACTSHDVTKMLSHALLDLIISLDAHQRWLAFLVSKGYLKHILDSLKQDDEQLQHLLSRNSKSYKVFYVFESKMALLARISSTTAGATALLQNGAISKLAECRVLDLRPDESLPQDVSERWILPDLMKCYQKILTSIMKLILSITVTLGHKHKEAEMQLLGYISCNIEFFLSAVRNRSIIGSPDGLQELSLVTSVLSRASLDDTDSISDDVILLERRSQLLLLRQHLLMLLPNILMSDKQLWLGQLPHSPSNIDEAEVKVLQFQVAAHILSMCCSAVRYSEFEASTCRILFAPVLGSASSSVSSFAVGKNYVPFHQTVRSGKCPDLGLVVTILMQCSTLLENSFESRKSLQLRLDTINNLTSDELAEYLPTDIKVEHMSVHNQRETAYGTLLKLLKFREKEVSILSYIVECSAFVLLCHLEYFLFESRENELPIMSHRSSLPIRKLQERKPQPIEQETSLPKYLLLNQQEREDFKSDVYSIISDTFFKRLQTVQQLICQEGSHVSFLEAVLNRIKRLTKLHTKQKC